MPRGQSPVDIVRNDVVPGVDVARLGVHYPDTAVPVEVRFMVVDGDDTEDGAFAVPQLVVTPKDSDSHVVLGDTRFDLQSFHWHSPSEHLLDGAGFPLELHLVHASVAAELLVVGVLSEEGAFDASIEPAFVCIPRLDPVRGDGAETEMRLDLLLPPEPSAYRYDGSLTTAPFTEGVRWFVCAEPRTASKGQIDAHTELVSGVLPEHEDRPRLVGNARRVQDITDRVVTRG